MKLVTAFITTLVISSSAFSANTNTFELYRDLGVVLDDVELAAGPVSFTIDVSNPQYKGIPGLMTLWTCVTDANNTITQYAMECTAAPESDPDDYTMEECASVIDGVCESVTGAFNMSDIASRTTNKCWRWRIDTEGSPHVECTVTTTGAEATVDTVKAKLTTATKGS